MTDVTMDKIVSLSRRRGFVFPSSEIYGGLGSTYDYGHYGVLTKNNIRARWFEAMVQSGTTSSRSTRRSSSTRRSGRHRATSAASPTRSSTAAPASFAFAPTSSRTRSAAASRQAAGRDARLRPDRAAPVQPHVRDAGRRAGGRGSTAYLRPGDRAGHLHQLQERAPARAPQAAVRHRAGRQVVPQRDHARQLPLPRPRVRADGDGVLRPARRGRAWHRYWIDERLELVPRYGLREEHAARARARAEERSHYSSGTSDIEYLYPIGWSELEGVANRGDFDLIQHTEHRARSSSTSVRTASATCRT